MDLEEKTEDEPPPPPKVYEDYNENKYKDNLE